MRLASLAALILTGTTASMAVIFAVTAAAATAAAVGIGAGKLDTCIVLGGDTACHVNNDHTIITHSRKHHLGNKDHFFVQLIQTIPHSRLNPFTRTARADYSLANALITKCLWI